MSVQNVAVSIHVQEQVITGVVSLSPGRRLSDYLNSDLIKQPNGTCTFLTLTDATILNADGTKERVETVYINVGAIQILRTVDKDSARGIGASDGPKQYPFVKKLPVRTAIRMSDYEINGYLHCKDVQGLPQLLAQELAFMPCTEAKVRGISGDGCWDADFVAVNRRQVHSFRSGEELYSQLGSSHLNN